MRHSMFFCVWKLWVMNVSLLKKFFLGVCQWPHLHICSEPPGGFLSVVMSLMKYIAPFPYSRCQGGSGLSDLLSLKPLPVRHRQSTPWPCQVQHLVIITHARYKKGTGWLSVFGLVVCTTFIEKWQVSYAWWINEWKSSLGVSSWITSPNHNAVTYNPPSPSGSTLCSEYSL